MSRKRRIVSLIDMDCFYVQCHLQLGNFKIYRANSVARAVLSKSRKPRFDDIIDLNVKNFQCNVILQFLLYMT